MKNLIFNDYILHESIVDKIYIENSALILEFNGGIYVKDKILQKAKMSVFIDKLLSTQEYEHIDICLFYHNKRKNINFKKFTELVRKKKFKIYLDFYSNFANSMLLKGTLSPYEVEIIISEINEIDLKEI